MGKVLKADATGEDAWVQIDLASDQPETWTTFWVAFDAAALAHFITFGSGYFVIVMPEDLGSQNEVDVHDDSGPIWACGVAGSSPTPAPATDTWQLVEFHNEIGGTCDLYVDGNLIVSGAEILPSDVRVLRFGQHSIGAPDAADVCYLDDIKIGTTRGADDLFSDDFEDGTLDAWSDTFGDVSVVDDPYPPPSAEIQGVCIAPTDTWAEPNPTWIRLDDTESEWFANGLRIAQVSIDRGKSNELDTTKTGTMAVTFKDPNGVLDPTNPDSPFYDGDNGVTLLDPNVQVAFARFNPVTEEWTTRFRGFTKQWSYTMDTSGFSTVTLEAVDLFELLADLLLTPGDQGDTPPTGSEGDIYYEGGSVIPARDVFKHWDQRIIQILTDAGLPGFWFGETETPPGVFSGNVSVQESIVERLGQIIDELFATADAEFPGVANIFCRRTGPIQAFGRFARFFPENPGYGIGEWAIGGAVEAASDPDVVRLTQFSFRRSKEDIFNRALALPQGLEDGDVPGQQVDDATSQLKFGIRPWFADDLLTWKGHNDDLTETDAATETKKFATYRVANYKDPKNRIEQITFRMLRVDHNSGPAVWGFLCNNEIGDVVNILTTHRGGGGFDEPCYIEGIREVDEPLDGTMHNITMQIDVSPKSFFDSNPFGEVDTGLS